jgi:hypothetical protein
MPSWPLATSAAPKKSNRRVRTVSLKTDEAIVIVPQIQMLHY